VADAAGELFELVVRGLQLTGDAAQLEHVDDLVGEDVEGRRVLGGELADLFVEDAERADGDAGGRDERARRVEAHVADDARHERIGGEPVVEAGIRHDHASGLLEHDRAHRVLPRADGGGEAHRGDLMLEAVVDDVDHGRRHAADGRGQLHETLQVCFGRVVEQLVVSDRLAARDVVCSRQGRALPSGGTRLAVCARSGCAQRATQSDAAARP
jgi:hypothetical protein